MQGIIITNPKFIRFEEQYLDKILRFGDIWLHIRKPNATKSEIEELILKIDPRFYTLLVLHDHHELAQKYNLKGIHLNSRNPLPPEGYIGSISRSCHSFKEIINYKKQCNYLFLSPIYNSTSKKGYESAYSKEQLVQAMQKNIIDDKVYALSGITLQNRKKIKQYNFGGYAILGEVWQHAHTLHEFENYLMLWHNT